MRGGSGEEKVLLHQKKINSLFTASCFLSISRLWGQEQQMDKNKLRVAMWVEPPINAATLKH
jgi:hypothetical protein